MACCKDGLSEPKFHYQKMDIAVISTHKGNFEE